jgi:hypothetical protein
MHGSRPLVYAAHPITSYGTPHERAALRAIRQLLPGARVLDPSVLYVSPSHWLTEWPTLAPTLRLVVLFGDETGSIGAGCLREVADALCLDVAVLVLKEGELRELRSLRLLPLSRRTRARTAIPVAGPVMEPALVRRACNAWRRGETSG